MNIHCFISSILNKNQDTLDDFEQTLIELIESLSKDAILVLPEYCWGAVSQNSVETVLDKIEEILTKNQQLILGSTIVENEEQNFNSAIYLNGLGKRIFIPKTNILLEEQKRHNISKGKHPGIINHNGVNILVLVCGDLWNGQLINHLFQQDTVDIFCIPAFTAVPPNLSDYAKVQWYSLTISRSREFIVPIAVADHYQSLLPSEYDVGRASSIADPSKKSSKMQNYSDFLYIPNGITGELTIDINKVREYKNYRTEKGLYIY